MHTHTIFQYNFAEVQREKGVIFLPPTAYPERIRSNGKEAVGGYAAAVAPPRYPINGCRPDVTT